MTVIDTTPTPGPVDIQRIRVLLFEGLEALQQAPCIFWACDGPDKPFVNMKTCRVCAAVQDLRKVLTEVPASQPTVTEYGVKAFSRHLGEHHVDACDDLESALSTLRLTQKRIDAWALLVSRQVPAPGPVGEWRAVSPDDAAVAFETAKAGAR